MGTGKDSVRVVIPAYNAGRTIAGCLDALFASTYKDFEAVVVDDGSGDRTASVVRRYPARLIESGANGGAARARNLGAKDCAADYILFLDSDCMIRPDTIERLVGRAADSGADSVIGCYTKLPASRSVFSVYHNLFQYFYFFRNSALRSRDSMTSVFWTGCGLVSRKAFNGVGGFYEGIAGASTEDDIFGYELTNKGYRIYIDMDITVFHDHRYNFSQLIGNYFKRALMLARTMFISRPKKIADQGYFNILNASALVLSYALALALIGSAVMGGAFWGVTSAVFIAFMLVNLNFYIFVLKETALPFAAFSVPINLLCYLATGAGAAAGLLKIRR